jgi:hypothetical protein
MQLIAIREIIEGEEIEISCKQIRDQTRHFNCFYADCSQLTTPSPPPDIPDGLKSAERKALLSASFGFECVCATCTAPAASAASSDRNRQRILDIWAAFEADRAGNLSHDDVFRATHELLQLCDAERVGPARMKRYFHDLMKLYFEYGDVASSTMFAERALELSEVFDGEDDLEGLQPALRANIEGLKTYFEEMAKAVGEGDGEGGENSEGHEHHHHHDGPAQGDEEHGHDHHHDHHHHHHGAEDHDHGHSHHH